MSSIHLALGAKKALTPPPKKKRKKERRGEAIGVIYVKRKVDPGWIVEGEEGLQKKSCSISCLSLGRKRRRRGSDSLILDPRNPSLSFSFLLQSGGARFSLNGQKSLFILVSPGKRGWSKSVVAKAHLQRKAENSNI